MALSNSDTLVPAYFARSPKARVPNIAARDDREPTQGASSQVNGLFNGDPADIRVGIDGDNQPIMLPVARHRILTLEG